MRAVSRRALGRVRLLAMDADGVLTDGGMYYSASGEALKKFNTRDGHGIGLLRAAGIGAAIITGERSGATASRARKLRIRELHQGIADKKKVLEKMSARLGVSLEEIAYIGDDLNDLEALSAAGFSACPADAVAAVRRAADYVCRAKGGEGAVREVCDLLLSLRDRLIK